MVARRPVPDRLRGGAGGTRAGGVLPHRDASRLIEWAERILDLPPRGHHAWSAVRHSGGGSGAARSLSGTGEGAMTILGIETATAVCGGALASGSDVAWPETRIERYVHAERLLGAHRSELCRTAACSADLDAVAVSIGPGSFTGLRIGLSAAKGLALRATGYRSIAGADARSARARRSARGAAEPQRRILSVLDARRDEVYCQLFRDGAERRSRAGRGCAIVDRGGALADLLRGRPVAGDRRGGARSRAGRAAPAAEGASGRVLAAADAACCAAAVVHCWASELSARGADGGSWTLWSRAISRSSSCDQPH
ncbi:MAG: tRNA (adenosine(37)-N6)-threonylcarbamoyltransferase complex dimerization subunit type 1 TsaB [Ignavibacteriales bacterium]|nr:tRNA (adenosine(37)-N6)-threonylcarbamoyltransferase complex dimerization subunit type 1 TsaB [Ignavibacteriales bacterium]